MPTYGPQNNPYPNTSDVPDGPGAFLALLQSMVVGGATPFATYSALTGSTGFAGELAVVTADGANNGIWYWNGSAWVLIRPFVTPSVRALTTTAQATSATAGSGAPVLFNQNDDIAFTSMHSTSSNTSRLIAPVAGLYSVSGFVSNASTAQSIGAGIAKNGTQVGGSVAWGAPTAGGIGAFAIAHTSTTIRLAANDYVEILSYATATSLSLTPAGCSASLTWVGA